MSLSMLYLRLTLISAFAVIALACITYAHSGNNETATVATLKGRSGLASGCITPSSRAVTGTSEIKNSILEKTCNF